MRLDKTRQHMPRLPKGERAASCADQKLTGGQS
jgi:hypothetical protein